MHAELHNFLIFDFRFFDCWFFKFNIRFRFFNFQFFGFQFIYYSNFSTFRFSILRFLRLFAHLFWLGKYIDLNVKVWHSIPLGKKEHTPPVLRISQKKYEFSQIFLVQHKCSLFAPTNSYASDNGEFSGSIIFCPSLPVVQIYRFEWKTWKFNFVGEKKTRPPSSPSYFT